MAAKKVKKEEKKAEPKEEVKKEVKKVTKEVVVEECKGHSGPPCEKPNCPEWGRW